MPLRRVGSVIAPRAEREQTYRELHAAVWPEGLAQIERGNIRNYTIFPRDALLFSYREYVGTDREPDMAAMAADPRAREWWSLTDVCQQPVPSAGDGEWWAPMEEVFQPD